MESGEWHRIMRDDLSEDHTGKRVWQQAHERTASVLSQPEIAETFVRGRSVLELGCGLAAVSKTCQRLGASYVVATDGNSSTVSAAAENSTPSADPFCHIEYKTLRFGNTEDISAAIPSVGESTDDKLAPGGFELIVGTELMYYNTELNDLVCTIAATLRRSPTEGTAPARAPSMCLLTHFYRRADLPEALAAACEAHGLGCFDLALPQGETDHCRCVFICWAGDVDVLFGHRGGLGQTAASKPPLGILPSAFVACAAPLAQRIADEAAEDEGVLEGMNIGELEGLFD